MKKEPVGMITDFDSDSWRAYHQPDGFRPHFLFQLGILSISSKPAYIIVLQIGNTHFTSEITHTLTILLWALGTFLLCHELGCAFSLSLVFSARLC